MGCNQVSRWFCEWYCWNLGNQAHYHKLHCHSCTLCKKKKVDQWYSVAICSISIESNPNVKIEYGQSHFYLWLLISFIKTPQPLTSVSLVSCPESSCRETRTDTREKTRRTWERRARATVGDGARTRARVGARTRRERAGAKEVRNRLCFTVVEYKSKAQHHQKTATDINLCPRSRSRSGERYRYVCTVVPLRRKSTFGVYCNEKAIL